MSLDPLFSEIPTDALNSTMDKVEEAYNAAETRIYDALVRKNIDELLSDKKSKISILWLLHVGVAHLRSSLGGWTRM
jgi:hypothetical protein